MTLNILGSIVDTLCKKCICNCNVVVSGSQQNIIDPELEEEQKTPSDEEHSPKLDPRSIINLGSEHISNIEHIALIQAIEQMLCIHLGIDIQKLAAGENGENTLTIEEIADIQHAQAEFLDPNVGEIYRLFLTLREMEDEADVLRRKWFNKDRFKQTFSQAERKGLLKALGSVRRLIDLDPEWLCLLAQLVPYAYSPEDIEQQTSKYPILIWTKEVPAISETIKIAHYQQQTTLSPTNPGEKK